MVTIDLNVERQLDEVFRKVEAGEELRIVRGNQEVMIVRRADLSEKEEMDAWAEAGARALALAYPANEFADWNPPHGTR